MRTYSHGVIGYLLYLRGTGAERRLAVVGGILPDVVLALGFVPHVLESRVSLPCVAELHDALHFGWLHTVTETMHSLLVVGALLLLAHFAMRTLVPVAVGMLAHAALDLLTHRVSGYNHFLPLPLEPIRSPISYTSTWFTVLEHAALAGFVVWGVRRWRASRPEGGKGGLDPGDPPR